MRNVLMVAYHYPPEGGSSGVLRTLKFSKYLPESGWRPHVLTLRESFYATTDRTLLADVPAQAVIHRTRGFDSSRHLAVRGRHLALLTVPDRFVTWLPFAVARGLRVIRRHGIEAVWSTSPPPTAHLIAASLSRLARVPWIADFRDPWIEDGLYPVPGSLRHRIEAPLERAVVRRATRLVATTPYLRSDFLVRYPELSPDRVRVIYNGYDESDFQGLARGASDRFELLHAGLVTAEYRNPLPLLGELAALLATGAVPRASVRVTFLGGGGWVHSRQFGEEVARLGLADVVGVEGRVSNRESLERMARASALLLLQASDDTRSLIPAKAFEYLRVGRPILALAFEGATAELLKGLDHTEVVSPGDRAGMRQVLRTLLEGWPRHPGGVRVRHPIERFERRRLTAELGELLDHVTGRSAPAGRGDRP